jgi:tRNA uridine 5-carboxymethylaminomethyl modification enzyme
VEGDWDRFTSRQDRISRLRRIVKETKLRRSDAAYSVVSLAVGSDLGDSVTLEQLSKRAGVGPDLIGSLIPEPLDFMESRDLTSVLADLLYEGYIENHRTQAERLYHHDGLRIPEQFDFRRLGGLSLEMVERLERAQPGTFGDARRIAGMTSAGLAALLVNLTVANPA